MCLTIITDGTDRDILIKWMLKQDFRSISASRFGLILLVNVTEDLPLIVFSLLQFSTVAWKTDCYKVIVKIQSLFQSIFHSFKCSLLKFICSLFDKLVFHCLGASCSTLMKSLFTGIVNIRFESYLL